MKGDEKLFPVHRSFRSKAVSYHVCYYRVYKTCDGCPFRHKRIISWHKCPIRALPQYKAGLLRKREENKRAFADEREIREVVLSIFSRGKK